MPMTGLRRALLVAATAMPTLTGCQGATAWLAGEPVPTGGGEPMPGVERGLVGHGTFTGDLSQAQSQTLLVARTPDEWERLWALVGQPKPADLPEGMMALGLFVGVRTSGGYAVDVVRIGVESVPGERDRMVVEYRETSPQGAAPMVITSPYAIVLVRRSDAPVRFVKR